MGIHIYWLTNRNSTSFIAGLSDSVITIYVSDPYVLKSPNYPMNYPNNLNQTWEFISADNMVLQVKLVIYAFKKNAVHYLVAF